MGTKQLTVDKLTKSGLMGVEITDMQGTQPNQDQNILPNAADAGWVIRRPKRAKVTAEEALRRTEDFINNPERREQFIAAIRKSKG